MQSLGISSHLSFSLSQTAAQQRWRREKECFRNNHKNDENEWASWWHYIDISRCFFDDKALAIKKCDVDAKEWNKKNYLNENKNFFLSLLCTNIDLYIFAMMYKTCDDDDKKLCNQTFFFWHPPLFFFGKSFLIFPHKILSESEKVCLLNEWKDIWWKNWIKKPSVRCMG